MKQKIVVFILLFIFALSLFSAKAFLSWKQKKNLEILNLKAPEINITLIEGWTLGDIGSALEKKNLVQNSIFQAETKKVDRSKYPILKSLPVNATLEGYLFPDTYSVFKPDNNNPENLVKELIKKALDNFVKKFTPDMEARALNLQMSVHQVITIASIIEKETGRNAITDEQKSNLDQERKIVAGIFYNRLNLGMPLESDATINYITKKNNPAPSLDELKVESAYNTYQNKGLPPGPICNPSLSSILAALYPEETDYLYFLHKQPSGEAVFSKTYEEHLTNKYKYLK